LIAGQIDAASMLDANHLAFSRDGTLPASSTRIVVQTPRYDHCMMTAGPSAPAALVARLTELLLSMSYADPEVRPLLDLEGLKAWLPGRTTGYAQLESSANELGFYDEAGNVLADDYRP
jgi:ABC-type phosphate/phosphonate transport system substrate-binding protein